MLSSDINRDVPQWIRTYTGKRFYPLKPSIADIDILDIAHALSNQCRFSGHSIFHFSVCQHSIYVSQIVRQLGGSAIDIMWGLLHDASEAYLVDLPTPIKRQVVGYNDAEKEVMQKVAFHFGLPVNMPEVVKIADEVMLATEARDLMGSPTDWNIKCKPADFKIIEMSPRQVMKDFLYQYATISFDIDPKKEGTIDSFYNQIIGPIG